MFLVYGLVASTLLVINTPSFQYISCEQRQIAAGRFLGTRLAQSGPDNTGEPEGGADLPSRIVGRARRLGAQCSLVARVLVSFPTANYPPFLYLPSAAGMLSGREFGLSVVLYLSLLLTGLVTVAIGALAIAIANGSAPWIFTMLMLPISLLLMASASQDTLLIACGSFAGALLVRGIGRPDSSGELRLHAIPPKEGVALNPPASVRDVLAAPAAELAAALV